MPIGVRVYHNDSSNGFHRACSIYDTRDERHWCNRWLLEGVYPMTYCDCMDCMVDGVGIEVKDQIKYLNYRNKCRENTKRTGLDGFFDD